MVQNNQKENNISFVKFMMSPNFSVRKQCFMGTQLRSFVSRLSVAAFTLERQHWAAVVQTVAARGAGDMCGELGRCRRTLWPTCQTGCHSEGVLVLLQFVTEK